MNTALFSDSWNLPTLISAYVGGVLSSLTPCVYPLIPITLSIIGVRRSDSRLRALGRAAAYVFGMTLAYTALGVVSARAGLLFGAMFQRPVFVFPFAFILVILACSELDILTIRFFSGVQRAASRLGGGSGIPAVILMGGASGLVAAPCIGPVLAMILGIAASSGSTLWGAILLFAYSLGIGSLFLVLAIFSPLVSRLPRSGSWLTFIKVALAIGLLTVAFLFVRPWIAYPAPSPLVALSIILGSSLLIRKSYREHRRTLRFIASGMLALIISNFLSLPPQEKSQKHEQEALPSLVWLYSLSEGITEARDTGKPLLVDFFADWCAACKKIDDATLSDPEIRRELANYWVITKIDFTEETAESLEVQRKFQIQGLPTILFFAPNKTEPHSSRVLEFVPPSQFLQILRAVRTTP